MKIRTSHAQFIGLGVAAAMVVVAIVVLTLIGRGDGVAVADILNNVESAYADCTSYFDTGVVETDMSSSIGTLHERKPFATAFRRPDRFRFEFSQKTFGNETRFIIWRGDGQVLRWWTVDPGVKEEESIGMAIAGATGVSSGSAHTIPTMLMPEEVGASTLLSMTNVERLSDDTADGFDCYKLKGDSFGGPMTLWIDKQSFLVRRIDLELQLSGGSEVAKIKTTYDPHINEGVAAELLEFAAPDEQ